MPTFSPYKVYQYSEAMMKNVPEKALKKLQKALLYSNVFYRQTNLQQHKTCRYYILQLRQQKNVILKLTKK